MGQDDTLQSIAENNDICYQKAVVTFIDLLGFKNLIQTSTENYIKEILEEFYLISSHEAYRMRVTTINIDDTEVITVSKPPQIIIFSDSIIRVSYFDAYELLTASNQLMVTMQEISSLAEIQEKLMCKGILLRGGFTIGNVYVNKEENMIFGPAMNRAYYIESTFARLPRIVIDPDIVCDTSPLGSILSLVNSGLLHLDEEMIASIEYFGKQKLSKLDDYLYNIRKKKVKSDFSSITSIFKEEFEKLEIKKTILEAGIEVNSTKENVLYKYFWAAKRLNRSVDALFEIYQEYMSDDGIGDKISFSPLDIKKYKVNVAFKKYGDAVFYINN